ncbi:hypothetical protein R1sor_015226 [Riccia sorocarpa]|uniref:Ubiquitin-activating enzyme E1 C-terminal domain-containing protein n=1 Tax=Riccia sorocarpa TaxID=122646 RepID=A0ABD3HEN1_9MARC
MVTMDVDGANNSLGPMKEIDELRYSRLIYTLGRDAVHALHQSKVLILGCQGVGAEIAKNLVLSGIRGLGLVDDEVVSTGDLAAQFLLRESDVGRNRAAASAAKLKEMNGSVEIAVIPALELKSCLVSYQVFVATTGNVPYLVEINQHCRSHGVPFILATSRGLFSQVFADFGDSFCVTDESGEPSGAILVESITQDFPATVTVVEEQRHGLEDGDQVVLSGIKGMEELNRDAPFTVAVSGTSSFTIPEDTRNYGRHLSGGYFHKVKQRKLVHFHSLEQALYSPKFCLSDPAKAARNPHLHVAFQAVSEFERRKCGEASISSGGCRIIEEDVLEYARELWEQLGFPEGGKESSNGSFGMEEIAEAVGDGRDVVDGAKAETSGGVSGVGTSGNELEVTVEAGGSKKDTVSTAAGSLDVELVKLLAREAHVVLSPMAAITGGIAAQEVIKAISGIFSPLNQWLYFDALECLPVVVPPPEETVASGSRYDLQIALFGRKFQELLGSLQWLVIGAGGLGSEVLKNLVMMGVGCNPDGNITVTDMDRVSRPNLVDQLLYQLDDLDRPKTPAAARALRTINPAAQIHALQEKVDADTEGIFDSSFFNSIAGVFSAVDSAQARLYIDSRCVTHRKPMIDGGKHGTKGSVQVFVPFQSEMYASSNDPPEHKEMPICTLKNFPYASEHTLQWAVETFETLFKKRPVDVNAYLSNRDFQDSIRKSPPASRLPILESLRDALLRHRPLSFDACVHWARLQFEDLFVNTIKQLCFTFPPGMTTTAGAPFWSGTKRTPAPLLFDPLNPLHLDFIVATANLQATVYGLKGCQERSVFLDILQNVEVPAFEPKEGVKIAVSDSEYRSMGDQRNMRRGGEDTAAVEACEAILQELPTPATLAGYRLTPIDFQKDDERNFHAEFVATAASLRACNYGIPVSDKLQARYVGGKIIPAIITSTAVVGGLMCLELYKILQQKPLADYKHAYFNLALPLFTFAEPVRAVQNTVVRRQDTPLVWTLWDRFEMDCIGMTLETFLAEFKRQQGLEITMLSYGKSLLYAEFLPRKKLQDRLSLPLLELITVIGKVTIPATESRINFSVSCTDANDEDVEVPDVIARVR